ncbi:MAG: S9 family peptidase [Saprospiraceae bacterium]|nr:S9 family peptidase [Saprospiraceae bacterium]
MKIDYPLTEQDSVFDDYHGHQIADPYRWLEDDHAENTKSWVTAQNTVTQQYLDQIPYRDLIRKRLEQIWNYERFGTPFKRGGKYYYFKNDGLQNQSVLYVQESLEAPAAVVLDPNSFSVDGTISLGSISFNHQGNKLAYQLSEGGSDWHTIYVKDLTSGSLLADRIEWVKFSGISWAGDGFFYSRFPTPSASDKLSGQNNYHKIYYHQLGTDQSDDRLIIEDAARAQRNHYSMTTEDERFHCISLSESTSGNALYVDDLHHKGKRIVVEETLESDLEVVDNVNEILFIRTNQQAPNWKLIAIDMNAADKSNWKTILPESDEVLSGVQLIGHKIFAEYLVDAKSVMKTFDYTGQYLDEVILPAIGSVSGISGTKDDREAFYAFTDYTYPLTIFGLNTESLESRVFKKPTVDFRSEDYQTDQKFYSSKDGTQIPIFITYKKGIKLDGTNPALLYGYGGFDISLTPGFSIPTLVVLENGGIYAVANIRGGGEYGKEWHLAGTKERKQNVFDDFLAAAEFLIHDKYTSPDKLAIMGGSNGGLLVGASMTQRPDLFKVAIPRVGVLDMLRYHEFTIGWAWADDYGRSDNPDDFEYLIKYSPLHNIREMEYPATFIMTADHDDRVVPAHSFKFAAELQSKQQGSNPALIRVETSAGHGAGKPTRKLIEENADMLSFMFYNMNEDVIYKKLDK